MAPVLNVFVVLFKSPKIVALKSIYLHEKTTEKGKKERGLQRKEEAAEEGVRLLPS